MHDEGLARPCTVVLVVSLFVSALWWFGGGACLSVAVWCCVLCCWWGFFCWFGVWAPVCVLMFSGSVVTAGTTGGVYIYTVYHCLGIYILIYRNRLWNIVKGTVWPVSSTKN